MWKCVPFFLCSMLFVLLFLLLLRLRENMLHQHFTVSRSNDSSISINASISAIIVRVFENRVLRRIFGPKRDEVTREWRRLHIKELNDLYSSNNIVRVIKSRRRRWAGHVACMGERRGVYRVLVG